MSAREPAERGDAEGAREGTEPEGAREGTEPEGAREGTEPARPASDPTDPDRPRARAQPLGAHDEIGIAVGPDGDARGLFDPPFTGTATGEHTAGVSSGPDRPAAPRRTAVLAWIVAEPLPTTPAPAGDPAPCGPLKRLIADEPLDPLPALDGVPARPRTPRARAAAPDPALSPEREDTATQIEGLEALLDRRAAGLAEPSGDRARPSVPPGAPPDTPDPDDAARAAPAPADPAPPRHGPDLRALALGALAIAAAAAWLLTR